MVGNIVEGRQRFLKFYSSTHTKIIIIIINSSDSWMNSQTETNIQKKFVLFFDNFYYLFMIRNLVVMKEKLLYIIKHYHILLSLFYY